MWKMWFCEFLLERGIFRFRQRRQIVVKPMYYMNQLVNLYIETLPSLGLLI